MCGSPGSQLGVMEDEPNRISPVHVNNVGHTVQRILLSLLGDLTGLNYQSWVRKSQSPLGIF